MNHLSVEIAAEAVARDKDAIRGPALVVLLKSFTSRSTYWSDKKEFEVEKKDDEDRITTMSDRCDILRKEIKNLKLKDKIVGLQEKRRLVLEEVNKGDSIGFSPSRRMRTTKRPNCSNQQRMSLVK